MKSLIYLILFLISITVFSQQKKIEITNIRTGKVRIYEENQRIKIKTLEEKIYIGKLKIIDNQSINIGNQSIKMDSIGSIKSQPKVLGTIKNVIFVAGLAIVGSSIAVATNGGGAAFLLFAEGTGITIGSGILNSFNPNNSKLNWTFKIIDK